jgi:hypothetical protein
VKQKIRFRMRYADSFVICPEELMPPISLSQFSRWARVAGRCNPSNRYGYWPICGRRVSQ